MSTQILQFVNQYSLYTGFIISIAGLIGNALNILVFTQFRLLRTNRCAFYLTIESISSLLYECVYLTATILTTIFADDFTGRSSIWCKIRFILTQIFVFTTFYTVCLATIDQFFSTNYWFNLRQMCTMKSARITVIASICLWIIHGSIFGSFFNVIPFVGCVISDHIALQYATFFSYPVLSGALPIFIAAFFGFLAFRNVRRIVRRQIPIVRRRLDQQMTAMVLIRVIIFVCSVLPFTVYRTYSLSSPIPQTQPVEYAIGRLNYGVLLSVLSLNYTVSFYLFLLTSSRFRRQVKFVLMKQCWKRWKSRCLSRHNQIAPDMGDLHSTSLEMEEIS